MKNQNPKLAIIAALGTQRELGKDNALLWHIPEDMARFRDVTTGHVVIMGRKTFQSIGKALPKRINIVITSDRNFHQNDTIVCHSFEEAIERAKEKEQEEIFVIGGAQIYTQALPIADKLYLTLVGATYEADTFFPDYSAFSQVDHVGEGEYKGLKYRFIELER